MELRKYWTGKQALRKKLFHSTDTRPLSMSKAHFPAFFVIINFRPSLNGYLNSDCRPDECSLFGQYVLYINSCVM
jgi:hypothetical protein